MKAEPDRKHRLLVISSVLPVDTSGGEIVMHRYLHGLRHFEWQVVTDQQADQAGFFRVDLPSWLWRLQHTRLSRFAQAWAQFHPGRRLIAQTMEYSRAYQPDVIVTVAHGLLWPVAEHVARRLGVPLVSIFMDWWPDLALVPGWYRTTIDRRFHSLYRNSAVALCISPGMMDELGQHPGARLQYPAAPRETFAIASQPQTTNRKFRVLYLGNMREVYARMTQSIFEALETLPSVEPVFAGDEPEWSLPVKLRAERSGAYRGFLKGEEKQREIASADALLVVMDWDLKAARRMRTSFPSKTQEYCQFGKPIIVWAPESSSAAQWALETGAACLVANPDVAEVVSVMGKLADDAAWRQRLAAKALECARTIFNPDRLQAQFEEALLAAINRSSDPNPQRQAEGGDPKNEVNAGTGHPPDETRAVRHLIASA
jgi:glycosyltransferase involved in cell wall biosynthesis